jgi:hypothetical protein
MEQWIKEDVNEYSKKREMKFIVRTKGSFHINDIFNRTQRHPWIPVEGKIKFNRKMNKLYSYKFKTEYVKASIHIYKHKN